MKRVITLLCLVIMLLSLIACGDKKEASDASLEGTEITVMLPPWGEPSKELLDSFTLETGITVVMNVIGWDEIKNKVSIASVGGIAPADVIEVDWSWVGEFGAAQWFEPIPMTDKEKSEMPTVSSFQYGANIIALPYANDFRLGYYNKEHFKEAGITSMPATWDELIEAAKIIKEKGITEYPLSLTLSASEAATTSLLWMTLSKYGAFFNKDFTVNKENVMNALITINKLVKEDKLIDPASQNMKDIEVYGKITSDAASFMVGPTRFVGRINNPEYSSVVGELAPMLVPGNNDIKTATFALPEGIGISKFSENKEAAFKFIEWYTSTETQLKLNADLGLIPTRTEALESLIESGVLPEGEVLVEQSEYISAPFPGGIPSWYSELSNTIYNSVNQMVAGSITPEEAYNRIEAKVTELSK